MLFALRDYLAREKISSLEQLAKKFKINALALSPMLDIWVMRGVLQVYGPKTACMASCMGCGEHVVKYYRYVEDA